jgi:uncharacterized protein (DUF302 family)
LAGDERHGIITFRNREGRMKTHRTWLAGLLAIAVVGPVAAMDAQWRVTRSVAGSFDGVLQALVLAIEGKGLVISYQSHVAEMLDRTGKDVGGKAPLYKGARTLEFCSAFLSRAAMEADIHAVLACPYKIAVYETVKEPGKVWLSYPRVSKSATPAGQAAMLKVEQLLEDIVKEAAQ